MARQTQLGKCERCRTRPATAGVVRTFYILKQMGQNVGKQLKGSLPAIGFCAQCLIALAVEGGATDAVLESLSDLGQETMGPDEPRIGKVKAKKRVRESKKGRQK